MPYKKLRKYSCSAFLRNHRLQPTSSAAPPSVSVVWLLIRRAMRYNATERPIQFWTRMVTHSCILDPKRQDKRDSDT